MLGLCDRWDSADTSMGHYQQPQPPLPPQQQQHQHASKAPGVFMQLPPPQQLSANGVAHMQGIFSHSVPPLQAASMLSHCACFAQLWFGLLTLLFKRLCCAQATPAWISFSLASLLGLLAAVVMTQS